MLNLAAGFEISVDFPIELQLLIYVYITLDGVSIC